MERKKKNLFRKVLLASGMMLIMSPASMATGEMIENDVTPPWGRLSIVGATESNDISYVDSQNIKVQLYANDDKCEDTEIKYYISTSAIPDNAKIETWYDYAPGKTHDLTLPSTTAVNTIYAVFKDKNGNTSLIFSNTNQNVVYNLNAADATMKSGANTTRLYGAPYVVTKQTPVREGYYFKGWGLNSTDTIPSYYAEDVIYPDEAVGNGDTLTFYAIWTTEADELPLLADVVKVGDYVNYPVYYDNVTIDAEDETSCIARNKSWRAISKDVDIDENLSEGTVNLVCAGIPMTYYHEDSVPTGVLDLAINFLKTPFTGSGVGYRKTGFNPNLSLTEVFTNKYTATYESDTSVTYQTYSSNTKTETKYAGTLKVRAMTKNDLDKVYDPTGTTVSGNVSVKAEIYQELLAIPCSDDCDNYPTYWLASGKYNSRLWRVRYNGQLNDGGTGYASNVAYGVRPVVSLKSEVRVAGRDSMGAWNIEI